jgi:hypothetical protein
MCGLFGFTGGFSGSFGPMKGKRNNPDRPDKGAQYLDHCSNWRRAIEPLRNEKKITAGTFSVPRTLVSRRWWAGREERIPLIFSSELRAD